MKDFLWMLYLAFTLFMSIYPIITIIHADKLVNNDDIYQRLKFIISVILWSIWYMYFLH